MYDKLAMMALQNPEGVGKGLNAAFTGAGEYAKGAGAGFNDAANGVGDGAYKWKQGNAQETLAGAEGDARRIGAVGEANAKELAAKTEFLKVLPEQERATFLRDHPDFLRPSTAAIPPESTIASPLATALTATAGSSLVLNALLPQEQKSWTTRIRNESLAPEYKGIV